MHLIGRNYLILLAVSLAACTDSTAPERLTARFVLNDINGRVLPTYQAPTPGLTPTILSGTLTLDNSGQAIIVEQRRLFDGTDITLTTNYTYEIKGSSIVFSMLEPCPPNANCIAPPIGTYNRLTGRVDLEIGRFGTEPIVYHYQPAFNHPTAVGSHLVSSQASRP
jgi:hypothetical protein